MFKLKSNDRFEVRGGIVFTTNSPVECDRNLESFVEHAGKEIDIDGTVYKILGVDMFMPATPLRIDEKIAILVGKI